MAKTGITPAPAKAPTLAELKAKAKATAGGLLIEPTATHRVIRSFGGDAITYKPGDRVDARAWMHKSKLERLRYIEPLDPDEKARVDALPEVPPATPVAEPGMMVLNPADSAQKKADG